MPRAKKLYPPAPYDLFHASDGDIPVAPSTQKICAKFLTEIGPDVMNQDPNFDSNTKRLARRAELNALINDALSQDTQANWINRLNAAGVPCGRVQSMTEVLADPQVAAQDMVLTVPHPGHGDVQMTRFPMEFSETPLKVRHPAPRLGADSNAILREAGFSDAEITELQREMVWTYRGLIPPL